MSQPPSSARLLPNGLRVMRMRADREGLALLVEPATGAANCPVCGSLSKRIHSRYTRKASDLPWRGIAVKLEVRSRKFFCDEPSCERTIFCERLEEIATQARKTARLEEALLAIALELGGEAGARLARELGLLVCPDVLLDRVRRAARSLTRASRGQARALGIDDFAFRKGAEYGTIIVDLERRRVVDLLPERSTESLARWLKEHPGTEVAARDRSHVYAQGIFAGAPGALQVADRWHLLHNLALALEDFLLQKRSTLKKAAMPGEEAATEDDEEADASAPGSMSPNRPRLWYARQEEAAKKRHERLVEQWREVRRLYLAGMELRELSRTLGVSVRTVYRYKDLTEPPPRPSYKRRASVLDPYVPYLVRRWNEGCHNGRRLYREIREQGYSHCRTNVDRLLAEFRRAEARGKPASAVPRAKKGAVAGSFPSAKNVAALFMRRKENLNGEQEDYLERLQSLDPALADARRLTQRFAEMARNLGGEELDSWLEEAKASGSPVMRRFAAGLRKDLAAVRAGLTETWSNGPVEGFIHKLKLLKRQGYGRANFDLLRIRMLAA
jgi:transposase